jgi:Xaa-Pro dipeptidase
MSADRRDFLRVSVDAAGAAWPNLQGRRSGEGNAQVSDDEYKARIEKARRLMEENKLNAILLESGTSLPYFTGVRWGASERTFALVIPAQGELAWVCPKFEEGRARELIRFGTDIRTWEEDESPYKAIAQIFKDRGIRTGRIGIDERVRFFIFDGVRQEASHLEYVSADAVTARTA